MIGLLIDQCVSRLLAQLVFEPIADVVYVSDIANGAADIDVMALARANDRVLVTEDYDFGALIYGERLPPPIGVIHLALAGMSKTERQTKLLAQAAALLAAAPGRFVVFSKGPTRSRALPS